MMASFDRFPWLVNSTRTLWLMPLTAPLRGLPCITTGRSETFRNKNPSPEAANHRQKGAMAQASPHILVVEDDRETRNLIAKYLRTNACNVTTATDGGGDDQRGVRLAADFLRAA